MSGGPPLRAGGPVRAVELVGPAGAGKSSIARALVSGHVNRVAACGLWGLPGPALLWQACALLPAAARTAARPRAVAETLLHLARIRALHGVIASPPAAGAAQQAAATLRLMDEGPVFGLAWLRMRHGDLVARGRPLGASWQAAALRWARSLDAILWLDAPDAVLARRIRERPKPHPVQEAPAAEVAAFALAFRAALDHVLETMGADAPRVVRISTAHGTPQASAARVAVALALDADGA